MNSQKSCHICGSETQINNNKLGIKASSWNEYHAHCDKCGIAYSNSKPEYRTFVWKDIANNIFPHSSKKRLEKVAQHSMNEYVRSKKIPQMCSEHSEDAFTWSVFNTLEDKGLITEAYRILSGEEKAPESCEVFYWGHNERAKSDVEAIYKRMLDKAGEVPTTYSEPDICLYAPGHGFMVVEVKYISGNDDKLKEDNIRRHERAGRMLSLGEDYVLEKDSKKWKWWELLRMWVPGCLVAKELGDIDFHLINLLPEGMLKLEKGRVESDMNACIKSGPKHRFKQVEWEKLLSELRRSTDIQGKSIFWEYVKTRGRNLGKKEILNSTLF